MTNKLYYGDNLDVMRQHLTDESVDLVYLDPPFNSGRDYNAVFKDGDGTAGQAQIKAFTDTWTWDEKAAKAYAEILKGGGKLADAMTAFKALLGDGSTLAYLSMMAPRLAEIRRVLKPTGSVYLHCDPSASHYLKILMDAVFGGTNFRNEIVWWYYNKVGAATHRFPSDYDQILVYAKGSNPTFNPQYEAREEPVKQLKRVSVDGVLKNKRDADGKLMYQVSESKKVASVWRMACLQHASPEQLGYPTQKPVALLDRIIRASSNPGDVILDPFCGCGTTIDATQALGDRKWIGIDITHLAVGVIKKRLADKYGPDVAKTYKTIGEPADLAGAQQLATEDTHQFEHWALGLVGARSSAKGKGGDKGIDGILLMDDGSAKAKTVPISVKSGNVTTGMVRDLRGVMDRDKCPIGLLVTLKEPTAGMITEAMAAGFYEPILGMDAFYDAGDQVPRIQILSVDALLKGAKPRIPGPPSANVTHKRAKATK